MGIVLFFVFSRHWKALHFHGTWFYIVCQLIKLCKLEWKHISSATLFKTFEKQWAIGKNCTQRTSNMASVGSFHFLLVALYFLNFLFLKACFTLYLRAFLSSLPEYAILIHFSSQYHVYFFKDFCFLCGTVLHFIYLFFVKLWSTSGEKCHLPNYLFFSSSLDDISSFSLGVNCLYLLEFLYHYFQLSHSSSPLVGWAYSILHQLSLSLDMYLDLESIASFVISKMQLFRP